MLVEAKDYTLTQETLTLLRPPAGASFTLRTTVAIKPHENLQLSGLYKSSGNFVTQCEAEGFRRITYFQVTSRTAATAPHTHSTNPLPYQPTERSL